MIVQDELFSAHNSCRFSVGAGWFVLPSKQSTAESQSLIFDMPGANSTYYGGQQSNWMINGIDKTVFYSCGDPCRTPSKSVVERASALLIELTKAGKLFPESIESVRYSNAWSKGANCRFDGGAADENEYTSGSDQAAAWNDGWLGN